MHKLHLTDIALPQELSGVVDCAVNKARAEKRVHRVPMRRYAAAAAVLVVTVLMLNFSAVAAFVGNIFTSLQNSYLQNPSRDAIVQNEYPQSAEASPGTADKSNGHTLALESYYADENEIGFEFTLTGAELPAHFGWTQIHDVRLEITDESGRSDVWESSYDLKTGIDTRTFPGGGLFLADPIADKHQYIQGNGQDFILDADVQKSGEGAYKLIGILRFQKPVKVGAQLKLRLGDILLNDASEAADGVSPYVATVAGEWDFAVDVDPRFTASPLLYAVSDPEAVAAKGIVIRSVAVSPAVCRVEVSIDYAKNSLASADNAKLASEPQYVIKLNVFDTTVIGVADGKSYTAREWDYDRDTSGQSAECYFNFDSMYFDHLDGFVLRFVEQDGHAIEVPVERVEGVAE